MNASPPRLSATAIVLVLPAVLPPLVAACSAACSGTGARHQATASLLLKRGNVAGALDEARAGVKENPASAAAWTLLGNALFEAQRYDEAEHAYRSAVGADADARDARRGFAQVALRRGRLGEAESALRELLGRSPGDLDARTALGALLLARGDVAGARQSFEAVVRRAPWHAAALYNLGRLHLRHGDSGAAEAAFAKLERATPGMPYSSYGRALLVARRGQPDEACAALDQAIGQGLSDRRGIERDPELGPVRAAPCFQALLARGLTPTRSRQR